MAPLLFWRVESLALSSPDDQEALDNNDPWSAAGQKQALPAGSNRPKVACGLHLEHLGQLTIFTRYD